MDSTFNPYLKWLGIPLKDQPPNHYRLLGVEPLESDSDIIERAADRQMTYIRSLQNGEHAAAGPGFVERTFRGQGLLAESPAEGHVRPPVEA